MSLQIAADDYGMHPDIDRAIYTLAEQGIVQKVSVMANPDYAPDPLPPSVQTGLHVNLTTDRVPGGKPLASTPFALMRRGVSSGEIADQVAAQYELVASHGFVITHIDTHQHVHLLPSVLQALIHIATTYKISQIRCLFMRFRYYPFYFRSLTRSGYLSQTIKMKALYAIGTTMKSRLNRANMAYASNLILMPLATGGNYAGLLKAIVNRFHDKDAEIVTHPGLATDIPDEPYLAGRQMEYQALLELGK